MKLSSPSKVSLLKLIVSIMFLTVTVSASKELMFGIQTAKSFAFFYGVLIVFVLVISTGLFSSKTMLISLTCVDTVLLIFLIWITVNRFLFQTDYSNSIKYNELLALGALYTVLRSNTRLKFNILFMAIALVALIQSGYGMLQLWNILPSNHGIYKLTGSFFNPGPLGGFLCTVSPISLGVFLALHQNKGEKHHSKYKILAGKYIGLLAFISIFVVLPATRSRATWLGAIIGLIFLLWQMLKNSSKRTKLKVKVSSFLNSTRKKLVVLAIVTIVIFTSVIAMYQYKKDSADGRLLIWKVSTEIAKDHPWFGVGYDMFKSHYMNYQANYFIQNPESSFVELADNNQYAFNELLLILVEQGIVGLLLFVIVVSFIIKSIFSNLRESYTSPLYLAAAASLLSIFIFGLFSYPSEILPIKVTAIICLAFLVNNSKRKTIEFKPLSKSIRIGLYPLLIALTLFSFVKITKLQNGYTTWKQANDFYQRGKYNDSLIEYQKIHKLFNQNGEYLIHYGKALSLAKRHSESVVILETAKNYGNNTILYTTLGNSYLALNRSYESEEAYKTAIAMTPDKFYPQYLLAKFYHQTGQDDQALSLAIKLIHKKAKVPSTAVREIKQEMKLILDQYSKEPC